MYIFSHFASQIFYAFADGADESLILCSFWTHFAELFRYASPLFTQNDGNKKKIKPGFIWNDRWQIDTLEYGTMNLVWLRRCKKIKQWYTITHQFTQRKSIWMISQIIFQKFRAMEPWALVKILVFIITSENF